MKNRVWVYDDEYSFVEGYVEKLQSSKAFAKNFKAEPITRDTFEKTIEALESRQKEFRYGEEPWKAELLDVDKISIFIIDYLLQAFDSKSYINSEIAAYLIRCFSKCGLIIGMNIDNIENPFDLTLRGHPESFCDLNIGSKQLDNPGLWGEETEGFRPWYWPQLPRYFESFQKKVDDVEKHINDPICEVLEIKDIIGIFPSSVIEFLGADPEETTFRQFVEESGKGLRRKDKNPNDEIIARIAAARVSKWLERLVLPGQNILIDAPHLVSRYPSLLLGDHSNVDTWNKTARFDDVEKLGLDNKKIEEFRFKKDFWLSRPAWFWNKLSNFQEIKEVAEPWKREVTNFVFCEDTSNFQKREDCEEFTAELYSPYLRRFVLRKPFKEVKYEPRIRLIGTKI